MNRRQFLGNMPLYASLLTLPWEKGFSIAHPEDQAAAPLTDFDSRAFAALPLEKPYAFINDLSEAQGINISPLTPLHLAPSCHRGLLVGFGLLPQHNIPAAAGALASVLAETGAPPT